MSRHFLISNLLARPTLQIFGTVSNVMFTVKPDPGIVAKSFKSGDAFYIGDEKLLPLSRFTNPGKPSGRYVYFLQATCICSLRSIVVKTSSHFFNFQFISEELDVEHAVVDAVAEGMQRT
jgi:hypothetical protein